MFSKLTLKELLEEKIKQRSKRTSGCQTDIKPSLNSHQLKCLLESEKKQYSELDAIARRIRDTDLPNWCNENWPNLQALSYHTEYLNLSVSEARVMVHHWEYNHYPELPELRKQALNYKKPPTLTPEEDGILVEIMQRLEKVLSGSFKGSAFVKLSSRCPKDAVVGSEETMEILHKILPHPEAADDNEKIIALNKAHIQALHCKSGKQVLDLMLRSERIYEDLRLALEQSDRFVESNGKLGTKWSQQFVLREWNGLPLEYEFRIFVYANEIRAISQYYQPMYFPCLVYKKSEIEQLIHQFFIDNIQETPNQSVKAKTPFSTKEYVMDVVVDLDNKKTSIIEFNPFGKYKGMGTGTQLFDIDDPLDRAILFGDRPYEFRIITSMVPDLIQKAGGQWRSILENLATESQETRNSL